MSPNLDLDKIFNEFLLSMVNKDNVTLIHELRKRWQSHLWSPFIKYNIQSKQAEEPSIVPEKIVVEIFDPSKRCQYGNLYELYTPLNINLSKEQRIKIKQAIENVLNDTVVEGKCLFNVDEINNITEQLNKIEEAFKDGYFKGWYNGCFDEDKTMSRKVQETAFKEYLKKGKATLSLQQVPISTINFDKQVLNPYPQGEQSYTAWEKGFMEAANKYTNREQVPIQEEKKFKFPKKPVYGEANDKSFVWDMDTIASYGARCRDNYITPKSFQQSKQSPKEIISNIELLKKPELKEKYFEPNHTSTISDEQGKDWEIFSFIENPEEQDDKNNPFILLVTNIPKPYKVEQYLAPDSSFNIHSVKRISDGCVFSIGDKVNVSFNDGKGFQDTIHHFTFTSEVNIIDVYFDNTNTITAFDIARLNIEKLPTPIEPLKEDTISSKPIIATTFDGVNIYDKNQFISIVDEDFKKWDTSALNCMWNEKLKYFSNKDAANNWVLENKPCLSLFDCDIDMPEQLFNQLKEKAKQKLKQ